jgi:hypothetical protein
MTAEVPVDAVQKKRREAGEDASRRLMSEHRGKLFAL